MDHALKADPVLSRGLASRTRLFSWTAKIAHFGVWQLIAQGLQLLTGLLLVRWMSYEAYAQFGLALGFQNMLSQLVDLGLSGSIVALVGERIHDRAVVGRYVYSAWSLRTRLLAIIGAPSALAFLFYSRAHHWPIVTSILLFVSIIAFLFFQGWASAYSPPLLMHGEIHSLYRPQVVLNAGKLTAAYLLHLLSTLGATAICWLNVLAAFITGFLYRASAVQHLTLPPHADRETNREFRQYLAPLIPGMVFYAFQGQIQILLISAFGQNRSIAEVAALGRLAQLFIFLGAFNGMILTPYIARVPVKLLGIRYLQAISLTVVFATGLSLSAFLFPAAFLWLLGPKYLDLQLEMGLSVVASSFSFITATLYSFNNARKWVYHWTGIVSITGLVILQVVMCACFSLNTTLHVMIFSVITAAYPIIPFAATAIHGFRRTRAAAIGPAREIS